MAAQARPRRFLDLHTHSSASDGGASPGQIVKLADAASLAALAMTDHDTTAGLAEAKEAASTTPLLRLIPGIEVSAHFPGGTLHILGLGIDKDSPALRDMLARLQQARLERNPRMLEKLDALGMELTMDDVLAQAGEAPAADPDRGRILGRLHIAQAMLRKGYVRSTDEAFDNYIGAGKSAYVDKERLTAREAIQGIHGAGGLAVLAHPPELNCLNDAQFVRVLRDLIDSGIDGIEAYHTDNTDRQTRLYLQLASRYNLGVTGGSDFHGRAKPEAFLGRPRVTASMLGESFAKRLLG